MTRYWTRRRRDFLKAWLLRNDPEASAVSEYVLAVSVSDFNDWVSANGLIPINGFASCWIKGKRSELMFIWHYCNVYNFLEDLVVDKEWNEAIPYWTDTPYPGTRLRIHTTLAAKMMVPSQYLGGRKIKP